MNFGRVKENELRTFRKLVLINSQLGNIGSSLRHLLRGLDGEAACDDQLLKGMEAHLKCDVADLFKQVRVLTNYLGFSEHEIIDMGDNRYNEARIKFKKSGNLRFWD